MYTNTLRVDIGGSGVQEHLGYIVILWSTCADETETRKQKQLHHQKAPPSVNDKSQMLRFYLIKVSIRFLLHSIHPGDVLKTKSLLSSLTEDSWRVVHRHAGDPKAAPPGEHAPTMDAGFHIATYIELPPPSLPQPIHSVPSQDRKPMCN